MKQTFTLLAREVARYCFRSALSISSSRLLLSAFFLILAQSIAATDKSPSLNKTPSWKDPTELPTELQPRATSSLLLDITSIDHRLLAVGERGHVVISADHKIWQQIPDVPTRSTLTAVTTVGQRVWAVGHDGVIIYSADGGIHWQLQRSDPFTSGLDPAKRDPRQGVPLLDVLFLDENTGFAIGAYSQFLVTSDGGKSWVSRSLVIIINGATQETKNEDLSTKKTADNWTFSKEDLQLSQETDPHLNAIARTGDGSLVIASERGTVFRSRNNGDSWERLQLPYDGSMFGVIGFEDQHVLVFGLRGNVYESMDLGDHWTAAETGTELSIVGGQKAMNGEVVLVGVNGLILTRKKTGEPFQQNTFQSGGTLANVLMQATSNEMALVGENGISNYFPP